MNHSASLEPATQQTETSHDTNDPPLLQSHYTKTLEELKAEARAIALSGGNKRRQKRQPFYSYSLPPQRSFIPPRKPTAAQFAANIHAQNQLRDSAKGMTNSLLTSQLPLGSYNANRGRKRKLPSSCTNQSSLQHPHQHQQSASLRQLQSPTAAVLARALQKPATSTPLDPAHCTHECPPNGVATMLSSSTSAHSKNTCKSSTQSPREGRTDHDNCARPSIEWDSDYVLFKSLVAGQKKEFSNQKDGDNESVLAALALADDDDEEFVFQDSEDDEEEEDEDVDMEDATCADQMATERKTFARSDSFIDANRKWIAASIPSGLVDTKVSNANQFDSEAPIDPVLEWESSIKEELEWLQEEDLQAAVVTLLDHPMERMRKRKYQTVINSSFEMNDGSGESEPRPFLGTNASSMRDTQSLPLSDAPGEQGVGSISSLNESGPTAVDLAADPTLQHLTAVPALAPTDEQTERFQAILQRHYQILVQQSILTIRTANEFEQRHKRKMNDGALQVPPENSSLTKNDIVFSNEHSSELITILDSTVTMLQDLEQNRKDAIRRSLLSGGGQRLTRAQFLRKARWVQEKAREITVFAIPGIDKLKDTFTLLDSCAVDVGPSGSLLAYARHTQACEHVLDEAGALYERRWLPEAKDVSENFTDVAEYLGEGFEAPCNAAQETMLRRHRNLLTTGEDSLILRGVNLFGEKQWEMVRDRFLPERLGAVISRRYNKLSVTIFRSFGVQIDKEGELPSVTATYKSLDQVPLAIQSKLRFLKPVDAPVLFNVHRWDLNEDVTLLKAVALIGTSWAVIRSHFLPHRDRTHLRKRYEVLSRRFKSTVEKVFQREAKLFAKWVERRQPEPSAPSCGAVNLAAMILRRAKEGAMVTSPIAFNNPNSAFLDASRTDGREDTSGSPQGKQTLVDLSTDSSRIIFERLATDSNSDKIFEKTDMFVESKFGDWMSPNKKQQTRKNFSDALSLMSPAHNGSPSKFTNFGSNILSPVVEESRLVFEKLVNEKLNNSEEVKASRSASFDLAQTEPESFSNESFASGLGLDMNEASGISFLNSSQGDLAKKQQMKQYARTATHQGRLFASILEQKKRTNPPIANDRNEMLGSPMNIGRLGSMEPPPTPGTPSALPTYHSLPACDIAATLGSFAAPATSEPPAANLMFESMMHSPGACTPMSKNRICQWYESSGSTPKALFSPDDRDALDAISALGQLSQTPTDESRNRSKRMEAISNSKTSQLKSRSLFQQVVGDSKEVSKTSIRRR